MPFQKCNLTETEYKLKFQEKIKSNVVVDDNGCWNWQKSKRHYGYGCTTYRYKTISTHRASWKVFKGDIPDDKIVCHKCDNTACCNPEHLWLGTQKENTRDMMNKKKVFQFTGEKNNMAILTELQVLEMRELNKKGVSVKAISKSFGLKYYTCLDAVSGRNWKHI